MVAHFEASAAGDNTSTLLDTKTPANASQLGVFQLLHLVTVEGLIPSNCYRKLLRSGRRTSNRTSGQRASSSAGVAVSDVVNVLDNGGDSLSNRPGNRSSKLPLAAGGFYDTSNLGAKGGVCGEAGEQRTVRRVIFGEAK